MSKENASETKKENSADKNFSIDTKNQRLVTENIKEALEVVFMSTGWPERAGEYAGKVKIYELMKAVLEHNHAFIQVYIGFSLKKAKNNSENFRSALELTQGKENVTLILFSAGALNSGTINIPDNVKHVIFISPMVGEEVIQERRLDLITKFLLKRLSVPKTIGEYLSSEHMQKLAQRANEGDVKITLITTENDTYIKTKKIIEEFKKIFENIIVKEESLRDHAPDQSEIIETVYGETEETKNSLA